jgi:hypothetical protein
MDMEKGSEMVKPQLPEKTVLAVDPVLKPVLTLRIGSYTMSVDYSSLLVSLSNR